MKCLIFECERPKSKYNSQKDLGQVNFYNVNLKY